MGLRTTTLEKHGAETSAIDWQRRLDALELETETAVASRDPERVRGLFDEAAAWPDANRAHQARKSVVEAVLATPQRFGAPVWMALYATSADALLVQLEAEPREPLILNYAGVLLYELAETKAA